MNFCGLKEYIFALCAIPSLSGFEARAADALRAFVGDTMEHCFTDGVGNHLFVKRCKRENAPKILIDTHFDEIGLIVREVCDGGFLRVCSLGGIDPAIMQAADVVVYGKETLRAVVSSTPPHLASEEEKLPKIEDMLIDTGLSTERARELIPVGTPIGFAPSYATLLNERIAGKSFDNKACGACALWAIINTPAESLAADVYLLFSSVEETNRRGGVAAATYALSPDYAVVIDVNLARVPDTPDRETVEMDKGISISISAGTHMGFSRDTQKLCIDRGIAHTLAAAPSSTGTNATVLNLCADGIPVVDIGLPLASMHTYNEVVSLADCKTLCTLVSELIRDKELAEKYRREELLL